MTDSLIPNINYDFVPADGHNVFREKFSNLSDEQWFEILVRSINENVIEGVQFPAFPEEEFQNRLHGHCGAHSIMEAARFYEFIKANTHRIFENGSDRRFLDFGAGWGRIIRMFLRDFEFQKMFAFEPNFLFCCVARSLNPYVNFFAGDFVPNESLPRQFFDLVVGWSIFSHLSEGSATSWLGEMSRIILPGGFCVFTTWGQRFLYRLQAEAAERDAGKEIHWYSAVCIDASGSIEQRLAEFEEGKFVWFTGGNSLLYGEAFISELALKKLIEQNYLPLKIIKFDTTTLAQDCFILERV